MYSLIVTMAVACLSLLTKFAQAESTIYTVSACANFVRSDRQATAIVTINEYIGTPR